MSNVVSLSVHDKFLRFEFTIQSMDDSELTIDSLREQSDELSLGDRSIPMTPEAEAVFSEWWCELPYTERNLYWRDQCDMEESYHAELEYEREREEGC